MGRIGRAKRGLAALLLVVGGLVSIAVWPGHGAGSGSPSRTFAGNSNPPIPVPTPGPGQ